MIPSKGDVMTRKIKILKTHKHIPISENLLNLSEEARKWKFLGKALKERIRKALG